jgi:glycosyltransferase involved in cell wall biosynthesis
MGSKYKVCAYAICKNEEKFVDRWMDSVQEADCVIVADTGSTDNTIEKLRERGATVYSYKIDPFRFDYSRNYCMQFIPDDVDVCVSTDMDEILNTGWRENLEKSWQKDSCRGIYLFNWSFNSDGTPAVQYMYERIHARHNYHWIYPTHEVLEYTGPGAEKRTLLEGVVLNHYPDTTKNRSFNLPLLELALQENPDSSRNLHYLGREYMYAKEWEKCIQTLKRYLNPSISFWDEERSASMRFIARAYGALGNRVEQKKWLYQAMAETPFLREPYMELAYIAYSEQNWPALYFYTTEALSIKNKTLQYVNEPFAWDYTPYDFAALACHNLGMSDKAIPYSLEAMKMLPDDERLKRNHHFYEEAAKIGK